VVSGGAYTAANNKNLVTKLLDATGTTTWSKTYNGGGDNNDVANYIALDLSGNVYVAGYSVGLDEDKNLLLHKMDASGNSLWTKTYTGTSGYSPDEVVGLKTDASNVYVLGSVRDSAQSYNYATIKYNSNGDTVWVRKYNNVNESDRAAALDVNASGNVAVTGRTDVNLDDTIAQYDFGTVLYNSAGVQQWATLYNSGGNNVDEPVALTLTATGNVYVSGRSQVAGVDDITTVKYNSTGAQQWAQTYNGGNGNDRNEAMVVDGNENVYICGRTTASNGSFDGLLIKYNSSGVQQWVKTFNGTGDGEDRFDKILLDVDGNITVAGKTDVDNTAGVNFDYLVIKYDNSGNVLWDTTWAYSPTSDDAATGLASDNDANLYVTGESYTGAAYSYATLTFGATPQVLVYNNNQGDDKAKAITVSGTAVYVTGGSTGSGTQYDATTVKYDLGTGIKEALASNNMHVYPNPASSYTNIHITSAINDDMLLVVTDVAGKAVIRTFPRAQMQLNTQGMAAGVYFVNLMQDARMVASQKLIVE
ncbi:MAG: T9SS type A sorting domain-containing protein, partial [Bacteroidetes bacterium]|nr:T9SS type A sorting domain-containing protein [Bacteroidota bacterium]